MKEFKLKMGLITVLLVMFVFASQSVSAQTFTSTVSPANDYGMAEKLKDRTLIDASLASDLLQQKARQASDVFENTRDDDSAIKAIKLVERNYYVSLAKRLSGGANLTDVLISAPSIVSSLEQTQGLSTIYNEVNILDETLDLLTD